MVHICNHNTEAGTSQVQGQPLLHTEILPQNETEHKAGAMPVFKIARAQGRKEAKLLEIKDSSTPPLFSLQCLLVF